MTDSIPAADAEGLPATAEPADSDRPPRRGGGGVWWLLVLLIAAGGGWGWLQWTEREQAQRVRAVAEADRADDALRHRLDALERELHNLTQRVRSNESRLSDAVATHRVLREEVLGVGERASLLEDAIARLAQARQEGTQALLLDEIDYLLLLATERLQLFADPEAALRAFDLADSALASLREPVFAGVRQTLAAERAQIAALPPDPRPQARARIAALIAALDVPVARTPAAAHEDDGASRLSALLGRLVTVRRLDEAGAPLSPMERAARASALKLQLRLALAAFEQGDRAGWVQGLADAEALHASLADAPAPGWTELRALALPAPVPALGATLRELRGLRSTRDLGRAPSRGEAAPAAAAPPAAIDAPEATGADEENVEAVTDEDALEVE